MEQSVDFVRLHTKMTARDIVLPLLTATATPLPCTKIGLHGGVILQQSGWGSIAGIALALLTDISNVSLAPLIPHEKGENEVGIQGK